MLHFLRNLDFQLISCPVQAQKMHTPRKSTSQIFKITFVMFDRDMQNISKYYSTQYKFLKNLYSGNNGVPTSF